MICTLAKKFIKDYDRVDDPKVRQGYGIISGAVGIALNIILVIIKLLAGTISGSIAIISDALNNLSDVVSSVVTLIGFKLAGQEADEEHPFGHGRLEYIAGLIVSLLIIIMAFELFQSSFAKITSPEAVTFTPVVVFILVVSVLIKFLMFAANLRSSKVIGSATLRSTAMDSISDVLSTSIVLISLFINHYTGLNVDGFAGIIVALFILKTGIESAKDTISPLLGEPPSKEFLKDIETIVLSHEGTFGVHDIIVHNYGPSRIIMSLHVEVPEYMTLIEVHDIIDKIEKELRKKYHCTAVIHMDPVNDSDAKTREMKAWLKLILEEIDPKIKFHDFWISESSDEKTVSFDLEIPYKYEIKDDELIRMVTERFAEMESDYKLDITVDKLLED